MVFMGIFKNLNSGKIQPSQDFLKEGTLGFILRCYFEDKKEELPPIPFVRLDPKTKRYIAIDGHNLLAVNDLLGIKTKVFVAKSSHDKLLPISSTSLEGVHKRNQDLNENFEKVLAEAEKMCNKGLDSIAALRRRYPFLGSVAKAKKHYRLL